MPQTEADWLENDLFLVQTVGINTIPIRCATVQGAQCKRLVTMIGGIPRESDRQRNLPLVNKLYGHLALALQPLSISSLLYNQPATGGSGGNWDTETLQSRTEALAALVKHFQTQLGTIENALIGSSSGAYMAVGAIEKIQAGGGEVTRLILLSPAAYPEKIERVPYGVEFTQILREPWDIATSPVFARLERFVKDGGKVLKCFFEVDDPPIPRYIQEYYQNLLREWSHGSNGISVMIIPGVAHNFQKLQRRKRENTVDEDSVRLTAKKFLEFLV